MFAGVFMGAVDKRRILRTLILASAVAFLFGCGVNAGTSPKAQALLSRGTYNVAIVGTSGTIQATTHLRVAIH
jgi:hypothetical protein